METWDAEGRCIYVTDAAIVSMKRCRVGGGCDAGIWVCRRVIIPMRVPQSEIHPTLKIVSLTHCRKAKATTRLLELEMHCHE